MIDMYKHLDGRVEVSIDDIAHQCANLNYGAHQLLSALVHALREKQDRVVNEYRVRHPDDEALIQRVSRSPLADALEDLLNNGYYY